MKLTVLTDNNSIIGKYFYAEPALSFFIEINGKKMLFDTECLLRDLHPHKIYPCHCTDLKSKIALSSVAEIEGVGSGARYEF